MFFDTLPSSFHEIAWPAIPDNIGASLLAMLYQLEANQWREPADIRASQLVQLTHLLRYARNHVPFYRQRDGLPKQSGVDDLDWDAWQRLPVLRRADVQAPAASLLSEKYPSGHGRLFPHRSAGSTGTPVTVQGTELTDFFWQVLTLRDNLWHRRDIAGMLAVIRSNAKLWEASPHGVKMPSRGDVQDKISQTGPCLLLDTQMPVAEQAALLLKEQPHYLMSYPSNITALVRYFEQHGGVLARLRQIITISEAVSPEFRQLCRQHFGVGVTDIYSCHEIGCMALQCPEYEHYHVQSEAVLLEVVDADGVPCQPGEVGRVLATPLHNFAMPLLRYDTGDYAEVGDPCPCGRGLPVLRRIVGRTRNMVVLPNGERRWPDFGVKTWLDDDIPVRQFQFVQKSLEVIEVRLVTGRTLTAAEEIRLTGALRKRFCHPFTITFVYCEELERSGGGKFEEFRSEVASA